MSKHGNLVWIDLEMTGLDATKDTILEIATIITDSQLNILQEGPHFVIHQPDTLLNNMNPWVAECHTKSGLIDAVRASKNTLQEAGQQTLAFIQQWCQPQKGVLAGNSIWQDRAFLAHNYPELVAYLHYRQIDVSSIKELVNRWYPRHDPKVIEKKDHHRALDDIKESIEELKYYRKHFFVAN